MPMPARAAPEPAPAVARRATAHRRHATAAALVALASATLLGACGDRTPAGDAVLDGLVALAAQSDETTLTGWDAAGGAFPLDLPEGETGWISTGRSDVLAATMASGEVQTSDPVRLGDPLEWRPVEAKDLKGKEIQGPTYFATWDPKGGRYAALAGDIGAGDGLRIVLVDPSAGTVSQIALDQTAVAAPPAWIDQDRLVIVTGDTAKPVTTIVDTTTGKASKGPTGVRFVATSANGSRVATMAGPGAPVVLRDTEAWLDGDGTSLGSVEPPSGASAAAFALDASGQRLVIAWADDDGTISLAVHDGRSGWRRTAQPAIGNARGAVVAWRR
jgi:hypothetical protein